MHTFQTVERLIRVDALVTVLNQSKPKGFYFPGESHDLWEGVFVYEGHVTATSDERVYQLDSGKLLFHKPMEFHRIWSEGLDEPRYVNISFRASGEGIKRFENSCFDLNPTQQKHFWDVVEAFRQTMDLRESPDQHRYRLSLNLTAARLEAFLIELTESGEYTPRSLSGDEIRYAKIVSVMKENSHRSLSVTELAALCDLSVSNMKRIFRCFSDVGVAKFYMSLRMRRAMELLDQGASASEAAEQLDFQEISYFYTVFKRETGMTPTEYRKKHM